MRHGTHLPHDSSWVKLQEEARQVDHAGRLVHHDHAAGAHDRAGLQSVSRNRSAGRGAAHRRQPPEGPPICTALNFRLRGMPPPMSKMISRRVMPIGTSTRPVLATLPASEKTLVPLLFSVPIAANHAAPVEDDRRDVGPGLDVVDVGRLAPQTGDGRERRARRGMPRRPSIEAISAVSSPQTKRRRPP